MLRPIILFAVVVFSAWAANAQAPKASPPPEPKPTPATNSTPQQSPATVRASPILPYDMRRFESAFPINPVSESDRLAARVVYVQQAVAPLYRKPSGKELNAIAPNPQLAAKYSQFLKLPGTGIFRLIPEAGCAPNSKVINAREDCLKYSMPGAGNSFSFRTENYRIRHLADVTYEGDRLRITGIFMLGMMANLGDVPLESVELGSPGTKFIAEFRPSTSFYDLLPVDASFRKGIEVGGYKYAKSLRVKEGTTYLYRGVAYRGKVVKSANGIRYNEMDYDKREDVIVAFRIIEKADDNSITIIWRQLAENESPKIKVPTKKEVDEDSNTGGN